MLSSQSWVQRNHPAQNGIHIDPDPESVSLPGVEAKRPKSVFISYSHQDTDLKDELLKQLKVLQLEDSLSIWSDDCLKPGDDWYPEIEKALKAASIAILLISADFLTSKFIRGQEVPVLLKRRKEEGVLLYIILGHACPWEKIEWLSSIQASSHTASNPLAGMKPAEREEALSAIASEIAKLLNESSSQ